jgi:hypothetical protein
MRQLGVLDVAPGVRLDCYSNNRDKQSSVSARVITASYNRGA